MPTDGPLPPRDALKHNKLCNVEDFAHPDLLPVLRAVFAHERTRFGPDFPARCEYRKHWEVAMAVRTLSVGGALHPQARILGIGAGNEPTVFWLTTVVGQVFATDLYLGDEGWSESANASMLVAPGRHWPAAWNPRRLVVQHMNALDLLYEDASFDGIFSSSSLEHFGDLKDVERAMGEMFRVLRPGGILTLSTEYRLEGPAPGLPGILMFDRDQIQERIIGGLAWEPVDALDVALSAATRRSELPFAKAAEDVRRHVAQYGHILFHKLDWSRYPCLLLREGPFLFTSIHLALRKKEGV